MFDNMEGPAPVSVESSSSSGHWAAERSSMESSTSMSSVVHVELEQDGDEVVLSSRISRSMSMSTSVRIAVVSGAQEQEKLSSRPVGIFVFEGRDGASGRKTGTSLPKSVSSDLCCMVEAVPGCLNVSQTWYSRPTVRLVLQEKATTTATTIWFL